MDRLKEYAGKVSRNHTRTVWILKCDIRKFFANIDHGILENILMEQLNDCDTVSLMKEIIRSFHTEGETNVGLPLGNLTSQLLVNIYMNEFDQFLKRKLKVRYCVRYADDFVILHESKEYLVNLLPEISVFLASRLKLSLHPDKVFIKTFASGVDFLGWVHFPDHRVLRTTTKKRMFRRVEASSNELSIASYQGLLSHGDANKLGRKLSDLNRRWKDNEGEN